MTGIIKNKQRLKMSYKNCIFFNIYIQKLDWKTKNQEFLKNGNQIFYNNNDSVNLDAEKYNIQKRETYW